MRAQYPAHATPFVDSFKEEQMKLVASYHGIYDADDFNRNRAQVAELYERAALPIEKGALLSPPGSRIILSLINRAMCRLYCLPSLLSINEPLRD